MAIIEKIILENFQSHKYSVIDLIDGLNVIVGPSDSGKTAILRGIKWVLYNEPSGDYFVREGESQASVTLFFDNKVRVKRLRSKSKNTYFLYDAYDNESKFEGFGTSVPEEIIDATGIRKIYLDREFSTPINQSDQLEGAFLLSEKSSTKANSIGHLVGVNILDDALRDSLKDNRNLSLKKKDREEGLGKLNNDLKNYDYLDDLAQKLEKLRGLKERIEKLDFLQVILRKNHFKLNDIKEEKYKQKQVVNKLEKIVSVEDILDKIGENTSRLIYLTNKSDSLKSLSKDMDYYGKISKATENLSDEVALIANSLESLLEKNIKLVSFNDKYKNVKRSIQIGNDYTNKFTGLEKGDSIFLDINNLLNKINILKNLRSNYIKSKDTISEAYKYIDGIDKTIRDQAHKYKEILEDIGTCPLCNSIIDGDKISHILKDYGEGI